MKNRIGQNRFKTDMETVQLVCELARLLPDHSIAPVLNRLEYVQPEDMAGLSSASATSVVHTRLRSIGRANEHSDMS